MWGRFHRRCEQDVRKPVHPHACGADAGCAGLDASAVAGSSPRVWGRCDFLPAPVHARQRFIPTRVGQIPPSRSGAKKQNRFIPTRVGQIRIAQWASKPGFRFIPTRVGQISKLRAFKRKYETVHPHACGADYRHEAAYLVPIDGSSPRVWGRSTRCSILRALSSGSSPRVWGRFTISASGGTTITRFIPTRVGQMSVQKPDSITVTPVHPHACGADTGGRNLHQYFVPVHPHACGADLTPHPLHLLPSAVHPHACGADDFFDRFHNHCAPGSSPRVWGRYFPKCSYDWILINCKPSKSMIDRRGFPYVSMVKPCSLLVE